LTGWATRLNGVEWFDPGFYGWGSAHDGTYVVDLAPYTYTGGGVAIAGGIATTPGSDYKLTFYASTLQASGRDGTGQVDVYIDGALTQSFNLSNSTATVKWVKETVDFTAVNATTYIKFQNEQDPYLHFAMIDDVSVAYIPPDEDGDGVPDAADLCLGTPSGTAIDATGCNATPLADLTMSNVSFGIRNIKRNAGTNVSVSDTVENLVEGSTTRTFNVAYHLSTDAVYSSDDVASVTTRTIYSLDGLSSNTWPVTSVVIPSTIGPGSYYLCAKADVPNVVVESDDTNNKVCTTKTITVPKPDFQVSVVANFTLSVTAGGTIQVLDSTKNYGGSMGPTGGTAFDVGYVLSKNGIFGDGDDIVLPTTRSIASLGVGATDTASTVVTIPGTVPPDSYWLWAVADINNAVDEGAAAKENNNKKKASNKVTVTAP
jgi:hypothetical protein